VDLRRERLHQQRGAAHRRDGLEHPLPLRDEGGDALVERPRAVEPASKLKDLLRLAIRCRSKQGFQVGEVLKHRAQRHAGARGDAGRARPQVAPIDEGQERVHDGAARAFAAREAAVQRPLHHRTVEVLALIVQIS
jgi:hypothetical protein